MACARGSGSMVLKLGQSADCASSMVWKAPAAVKAKMPEPRLVGSADGNEDGLAEDVGVDLVEDGVVLRDAAGVDDAVDGDAVFGHAFEDDAGVEGGAFDGGEELVLRGVDEVPAEGDAAEFGVDEDGAVAVVPAQAEEAGLAGADRIRDPRTSSATVVLARRAMASKISPVAERPASMPV